ncbi:hypothetical protein K2Z84_31850, partial [Candidatus Binatia bacterium]|nr:hypothetical protein [Candidatus Binatia bacterium]
GLGGGAGGGGGGLGGGGLGGGGGSGRFGGGGRSSGGLSSTQQLGGGGGGGGGGSGGLGRGSSGGLGGSGSGSSRNLGGGGSSGARRGAASAGALGGQQGAGGGGAAGFVIAGGEGPLSMFKKEVRVVADEIANAIVILATKRDYEQILKVLRDLDVVPRQVVIEVLIAEISLNKSLSMGLQTTLSNPGSVNTTPTPAPSPTASNTTDGTTSLLNTLAATTGTDALKRLISIAPTTGALTALITDQSSFRIQLTALAAAGRAKVLASPNILTADNREASIHIGTEIPILTSKANFPGIQGANGSTALVNSVQYRSTGVILTVLPQVNADGLVNLQVRQEVSDVGDQNFGSTGSPSFITRAAETTAVVQNGDSLLIGGIIQETSSRGRSGVPYLMDLPLVGRLFRVDTDAVRRIELIIMLTPHVIRNRSESLLVTEEYKDRLWDVVDEIERTSGLKPPSQAEMNYIRKLRNRSTTNQKPGEGLLPNRESND